MLGRRETRTPADFWSFSFCVHSCPQCKKRLGNSVIAVHSPRGEVTHLHVSCRRGCRRRRGRGFDATDSPSFFSLVFRSARTRSRSSSERSLESKFTIMTFTDGLLRCQRRRRTPQGRDASSPWTRHFPFFSPSTLWPSVFYPSPSQFSRHQASSSE